MEDDLRAVDDQLRASRGRRFVGRTTELARFDHAVVTKETAFLWVSGPGGVGKTSLLHAMADLAARHELPVVQLDLRDDRAAITAHLRARMEGRTERLVVLLDNADHPGAPVRTLIERELPSLSHGSVVVFASRSGPDPAWQTATGWRELVSHLPLRNLEPEPSRALLAEDGIEGMRADRLLRLTHGHPLALALAARSPDLDDDALRLELLDPLWQCFVRRAPSRHHQRALEAACVVRRTTESLLRAMFDEDAHEVYRWLRELPFFDLTPEGLVPHDLVRELVITDLATRDPSWRATLHTRARAAILDELDDRPRGPFRWPRSAARRHRLLFDLAFLHRHNPMAGAFFRHDAEPLALHPPDASDRRALRDSLLRFRGPTEARWIEHWIDEQPERCRVVHGRNGRRGFLQLLAVTRHTKSGDPAIGALQKLLEPRPLRGEEVALVTRCWLSFQDHQAVSDVQSAMWVETLRVYANTPGMRLSVAWFHDPDFWAAPFTYMDFHRTPTADYQADGHTYGAFTHDWRVVDHSSWQQLLFDRELDPSVAPPTQLRVIALARPEFEEAVHHVLRHWEEPRVLRTSPLARSRFVLARPEPDPTSRLRAAVRAHLPLIEQRARGKPWESVLRRTWLEPTGTQEQTANRLGLPFSTYRRYLGRATSALIDALWLSDTSV